MKSTIVLSSLFAVAATAQMTGGGGVALQQPRESPKMGSLTSQGCFSSKGDLKEQDGIDKIMLSSGACSKECEQGDFAVAALSPNGCFCGNSMPPKTAMVADSKCSYPCPAYAMEACGGMGGDDGAFSVYNLGVDIDPPTSGGKGGDNDNGDDNDNDDKDEGDEDDKTSSATDDSSSSSVTGTSTNTVTTTSAESPEGTEATTTASTPAETTSSSEEADEGEGGNGGDEEEEEGGEGDAGSTLGRSIAVVAAVAGGSAWFML